MDPICIENAVTDPKSKDARTDPPGVDPPNAMAAKAMNPRPAVISLPNILR